MLKAYSNTEKQEVFVQTIVGNEVVYSLGEGEENQKLFGYLSDFANTGKLQENYREVTEKLQGDYREITPLHGQNYSPVTPMGRARQYLPPAPGLKQEIKTRWPLYIILSQDETYRESSLGGFNELLSKIKKGELKGVPRPVCRAVNNSAGVNVSIPYLNRAIGLYIEYEKQRPPRWLLAIDNALNQVDRLINLFIIKIVL